MKNENENNELVEAFLKKMKSDFLVETLEPASKYHIVLQENVYEVFLTDKMIESDINSAIEILDALQELHEEKKITKSMLPSPSESVMPVIKLFIEDGLLYHENIDSALSKVNQTHEIMPASWMLMSKPVLLSAIYSVSLRFLDDLADEDCYLKSLYFLLRAILKCSGEKID